MEAAVANLLPKHTFWEDGNTGFGQRATKREILRTFPTGAGQPVQRFV